MPDSMPPGLRISVHIPALEFTKHIGRPLSSTHCCSLIIPFGLTKELHKLQIGNLGFNNMILSHVQHTANTSQEHLYSVHIIVQHNYGVGK